MKVRRLVEFRKERVDDKSPQHKLQGAGCTVSEQLAIWPDHDN